MCYSRGIFEDIVRPYMLCHIVRYLCRGLRKGMENHVVASLQAEMQS
jgi:hypothetical protein